MDAKTNTSSTLNTANATSADEEPTAIRLYGAVPDSIVDGPGLRYSVFVQGCSHGCPGCHNPESQPRDAGETTTIDAVLREICENGLVHDVTFSGGEPFEQAAACAALARRLKALEYGIWTYTGYLYEDLEHIAQAARENAGDATGEPADTAAEEATADSTDSPTAGSTGSPTDNPNTGSTADPTVGSTNSLTAGSTNSPTDKTPLLDPQAVADFLDCIDVLVDGSFIEEHRSLALQWRGSSNQRLIDIPATRAAGHIVEWSQDVLTFEKPASW